MFRMKPGAPGFTSSVNEQRGDEMPDRRFKPKKRPAKTRNHVVLLILLVVLMAGSIFMFSPPAEKIKQGLDVQGGLSVVMQASKVDGTIPSAEEMQGAREIVERRVNLLGASEASVQLQGTTQLMVQIPGVVDQTQALETIGQTGVLEFVDLTTIADTTITSALETGQIVSDQDINEGLAFKSISADEIKTELVDGRVPQGMYVRQTSSSSLSTNEVGQIVDEVGNVVSDDGSISSEALA
ncbi:MAG: hypothetical protein LBG97_07535, partial [Coriobacteriales bacterium]|nr:hypothetical protein [Coriobacteriales bacterium]